MSLSSSFNPFEIRNRQQQSQQPQQQQPPQQQEYYYHQNQYYQGIPDIPIGELTDEEVSRLLFQKTTQATRRWKFWNSIIVRRSMRITGIFLCISLGLIIVMNTLHIVVVVLPWTIRNNNEKETLHRPHYVPTLLSVIDPTTGHSVYALNNTLYERLLHDPKTEFVTLEESKYYKYKNKRRQYNELPMLSLDKTTIRPVGDSITLSWTLGREKRSSKNVLVKDDDVIALYCGRTEEDTMTSESRDFLEAATIAQAKTTSIKNGRPGDDDDTSWYISNFPILRQESCHFRLYLTDDLNNQFIYVASTRPFRIESANETPTAIHLAYTNSSSEMIIQFTTGYASDNNDTSVVPVVRYVESDNKDLTQSTKLLKGDFITVTGTTDTYSAQDLCEAPANQTEAGKFYPPGLLHTVQVGKLKPSTMYMYQVGVSSKDDGIVAVWSDPAAFKSPPKDGDPEPFNYIVYGDQGKYFFQFYSIICDK
jgi:hypothetical protein